MSQINANTIADAAGTGPVTMTGQSASKAWCEWNGTGTPAIIDSFNLSSLTDNGTGDSTQSLTNSMDAAIYPGFISAGSTSTGPSFHSNGFWSVTAGSYRVDIANSSGTSQDRERNSSVIMGDLA